MKRYEILCDEKHLFISVIGSYVRRELTIPIGALLTDRHGGRPKLLGLFSDGRISVEGHRPFQPLSFEANFVLDEFLTQGHIRHPKQPDVAIQPHKEAAHKDVSASVVRAEIAGLPLEVVDGEWVTLRSLFEPFGKGVAKQVDRLGTWASLRKFRLASRGRDNDFNRLETWAIDRTHVAQAIAELDPRGMSDDVRAAFVRFKRECAAALDAYFTKGQAHNPRFEAPQLPPAIDYGAIGAVVAASIKEVVAPLFELVKQERSQAHDSQTVPDGYEFFQTRVAQRLGLPEESHGRCLVSDWAKEFRMHGVAPWSVWTSATFGNYVKHDCAVMYSEEFIEAIRPSAEAALAEMKVCGYRVVSGKLSPLCVSPTSKTDCVTRMRDAGIAARKAA